MSKLIERAGAIRRDIHAARTSKLNRITHGPQIIHGDGTPVLMLHGYLGHPSDLSALSDEAAADGHSVMLPVFGPLESVHEVTERVIDLLETFHAPAHVVAHSLGGVIVVRAAMERPELMRSLTTIASPLGGAPLAVLPVVRKSPLSAVLPLSPVIADLRRPDVPMLSIGGTYDPIVPWGSALALVERGDEHLVVPEGHASVLRNPDVLAAVKQFHARHD